MRDAMKTGVTREEMVELVLQASNYAGVPACMNAITAAKKAFLVVEGSLSASALRKITPMIVRIPELAVI
ncbi:carboxymuconolactone decarboxylase family protein [uncultured Roseobacter sp.]|uniref:carboxymuconolactone decarboxylase family protein n=1 Tax=uncultured Roseobacter sp. TaxID=114847 RepID=UPI00260F5C60|nr:carboxymuconolactone decarboxylase family protein [uncultured Roseobacter sp.]